MFSLQKLKNDKILSDGISAKIKSDLKVVLEQKGIKIMGIVADVDADRLKIGLVFNTFSDLQ